MTAMSRFKFVRASEKGPEDMPTKGKSLTQVLDYDSKGNWNVEARVSNFYVDVYKGCPKGSPGFPGAFCGSRLPEKSRTCERCHTRVSMPLQKMFIRIDLQDLKSYTTKTCTMFDKVAERFVGMNSKEYAMMEKMQPEVLDNMMDEKLDVNMIFNIDVKPQKDQKKYPGMDWTIRNFAYLPKKVEEEEETDENEEEKDSGVEDDDDEEKEEATKKKKKKTEKSQRGKKKEEKDDEEEDDEKEEMKKEKKKKRQTKKMMKKEKDDEEEEEDDEEDEVKKKYKAKKEVKKDDEEEEDEDLEPPKAKKGKKN